MKIGNNAAVFDNFEDTLNEFMHLKELGYDTADVLLHKTENPWYASDEAMAAKCAEIRECADRSGLEIFQVHGPWPTDDKSPESREKVWEYMHRCVYACGLLNAPYLVIHPQMPFGWEQEHDNGQFARELTVKLLRDLVPDCEKYNVTVCLENMPMKKHFNSTMENIVKMVKEADSPYIQICMDTGHSNIFGHDLGDDVRCAGSLLKTIHIHDNNGNSDQHLLPYLGTADWDSFVKALAEVGFEGSISMETNGAVSSAMPSDVYSLAEKVTVATAKSLAAQVKNNCNTSKK